MDKATAWSSETTRPRWKVFIARWLWTVLWPAGFYLLWMSLPLWVLVGLVVGAARGARIGACCWWIEMKDLWALRHERLSDWIA